MQTRLFVMVALFAFPGTVNAGLIYGFGQANYDVLPGEQVDVEVFLEEELGQTILTDEGLVSASVRVRFDQPPVPSDPASIVSVADIVRNAEFDDDVFSSVELTPGMSAGMLAIVEDIFSPVMVTSPNRILIGTITFTAGSIPGEVTNLLATDLDPLFADTLSGSLTELDNLIADGMATITVINIPEPNSGIALGGLLLLTAMCGTRRGMRFKCLA